VTKLNGIMFEQGFPYIYLSTVK